MAAAAIAATAGQILWRFERECPLPCLNTCSPVGINVWERSGDAALLERVCYSGQL